MAIFCMNVMCVILFRDEGDISQCNCESDEDTRSHGEIKHVFMGHETSPESNELVDQKPRGVLELAHDRSGAVMRALISIKMRQSVRMLRS